MISAFHVSYKTASKASLIEMQQGKNEKTASREGSDQKKQGN